MGPKSREHILQCYERLHRTEYLDLDPLGVLRSLASQKIITQDERVWFALLGALFAFGGVKQIRSALSYVIQEVPFFEGDFKKIELALSSFRHRVYVGADLIKLFELYQNSIQQFGGLKEHFELYSESVLEVGHVGPALVGVMNDYRRWSMKSLRKSGPHFSHLLNSPRDGGTCKRWLMFLKWMLRPDDGIDLGWFQPSAITPQYLLIPLDVHLTRIARRLRLTDKKSVNFKTVLEVTKQLKQLDAIDPTRFDFSLCREGMLQSKQARRVSSIKAST